MQGSLRVDVKACLVKLNMHIHRYHKFLLDVAARETVTRTWKEVRIALWGCLRQGKGDEEAQKQSRSPLLGDKLIRGNSLQVHTATGLEL